MAVSGATPNFNSAEPNLANAKPIRDERYKENDRLHLAIVSAALTSARRYFLVDIGELTDQLRHANQCPRTTASLDRNEAPVRPSACLGIRPNGFLADRCTAATSVGKATDEPEPAWPA
jgi:hypothetical protein